MRLIIRSLIVIVFIFLFFSCQSFPRGDSLSDLALPDNGNGQVSFSTVDLYRYFTLCRAVWREGDKWQKIGWALDYFYNEETNTLGVFLLREGVLHIAFRSSQAMESLVDLKYNSRIGLKKIPFIDNSGIRVFGGFLEKYMSIREEVHDRIENSEVNRIILVGHSGGGAMASIAFLDLTHQYPDINLKGVVFGPVRTYNKAGAKWFLEHQNNFIRIVNGRDMFSNLPPSIFGYRHVGRLIRMGSRPWYKIFSFKDHHPGYRIVLEDLLIQEGINPDQFPFY